MLTREKAAIADDVPLGYFECPLYGENIWKEEVYRTLQGTYPVISLSFANIKESIYEDTGDKMCRLLG